MNITHLTKKDIKEFGKIPNIKTELGLKRLFSKLDKDGNSKDYDFFFYQGFLYQAESLGWDTETIYTSVDAEMNIETQIYFNNSNNRLFKSFKKYELMSYRNDITYYTLNNKKAI